MTLLAYCVTPADAPVIAGGKGVSDAAVEHLEVGGLRVYFSELTALAVAGDARRQPLEFQAVVERIFAIAPVAPFRFPTLLDTRQSLHQSLEGRASDLTSALQRLGDSVQMELRVTAGSPTPAPVSGREYLLARRQAVEAMQRAADELRSLAGHLVAGWRVRPAYTQVRCFALVHRGSLASFTDRIRAYQPPGGVHVLCSGPWPPAEFIEEGA